VSREADKPLHGASFWGEKLFFASTFKQLGHSSDEAVLWERAIRTCQYGNRITGSINSPATLTVEVIVSKALFFP
jgi:hypothetical protein